MARRVLAVLALAVWSGCNCGRQIITTPEASLTLASDVVDFGVVPEGTSRGGRFRIDNSGRVGVAVTITLEAGGSADFSLGVVPASVEGSSFAEVPVVFTPVGPGSDEAVALVRAAGSDDALRVTLRGAPLRRPSASRPTRSASRPPRRPSSGVRPRCATAARRRSR